MTIGIIGQACIDKIVNVSGKIRSRSLGGILYSYAALERLARDSDSSPVIMPLGYLSVADQDLLTPFLTQLHHFDLGGMIPTDSLTNRVQLVYHTDSDRTERCPTILPSITCGQLSVDRLKRLDALFVNMISGFDLKLEAMQKIAAHSDQFGFRIHLDIHALALGSLSQGNGEFGGGRKPEALRDWEQWISCAHTVQLNELEADHIGAPDFAGQKALIEEIKRLKSVGELPRSQAIILTRAAEGARLYDLDHRTQTEIAAPPVTVVDSTGSGDVFGASLTYYLASGKELTTAVQRSVEMATWNTQLHSLPDILDLERGS